MNSNCDKEKEILHECLILNNKDPLVREYGGLIQGTVRKTLLFSGIPVKHITA